MKYITYQGQRIYYHSKGKGPAVVLLHGFCEDSRIWEDFKADLLEEKYRVVLIDLPGFGQSDVVQDISIAEMSEAVIAVLDALKLKEVILIGHSMGGYVSLALAENYAERLAGLGMFHSQALPDNEEKQQHAGGNKRCL